MAKKRNTRLTDAGINKNVQRKGAEKIVIRGCGGHFNGVYDIDQLIIKLLAFAFIICLIGIIFL